MQEYSHSVGIERVARQPIATYGFLEFAYVLFIHTTLAICGFIQILWIRASDVAYNKAFGIYVSLSAPQMNGELNGLHVYHEDKTQAGWPKQVASLPLSGFGLTQQK